MDWAKIATQILPVILTFLLIFLGGVGWNIVELRVRMSSVEEINENLHTDMDQLNDMRDQLIYKRIIKLK